MKPLSSTGWFVQFTATSEFAEKISRTLDLMSHSMPNRSLAELFERWLDALIDEETKRRFGSGRSRERRATASGSPHVPVDVRRSARRGQTNGAQGTPYARGAPDARGAWRATRVWDERADPVRARHHIERAIPTELSRPST